MALMEVKVPDIGDFDEVSVIELLVKPGDTVKAEQSLVTVESDKASMEIPSSAGGVVRELKVKIGDKLNIGDLVAVLDGSTSAVAPKAVRAEPVEAADAASVSTSSTRTEHRSRWVPFALSLSKGNGTLQSSWAREETALAIKAFMSAARSVVRSK